MMIDTIKFIMKISIVSANISEYSKTQTCAKFCHDSFKKLDCTPNLILLNEYNLPHCDGKECYSNKEVQALTKEIEDSEAIIIVTPIYNYNCNSITKNFIELTNNRTKEG